MAKEDFDAEVYEYAKSRIDTEDSRMTDRMLAYRAGAEPREKKIEELENQNRLLGERCNQLLKDKGELTDQIEKMKCCGNCKYSNQESAYSIICKVGGVDKSDYVNTDDNQVCDKWELRR